MKPRLPQRMLLRVYLHGILMLALAAGASFVVGTYVLTPAVEVPARPSTAWIAWHLMSLVNNPIELERELGDLKRRARLEMTLFDANGRLIASNAASRSRSRATSSPCCARWPSTRDRYSAANNCSSS